MCRNLLVTCVKSSKSIFSAVFVLQKFFIDYYFPSLREMCPNTEFFFWSVFSGVRNEYGKIPRISPYSVPILEKADRKKLRVWTLHAVSRVHSVIWWYNIELFVFLSSYFSCLISWKENKTWQWNFVNWRNINLGTLLWKNHAENVQQKLVPDFILVWVSNPKQPMHTRNSFKNKILKEDYQKTLKKVNIFSVEPGPF